MMAMQRSRLWLLGLSLCAACQDKSLLVGNYEEPLTFESSVQYSEAESEPDTLVVNITSKVPSGGALVELTYKDEEGHSVAPSVFHYLGNGGTERFPINIELRDGTSSVGVQISSRQNPTNSAVRTVILRSGVGATWPATPLRVPALPSVNIDLFPSLNWNDVVAGRSDSYDFNGDGVPDLIAHEAAITPNPPLFRIADFSGKTLYTFDLKAFKPTVRDSLHHIGYESADLDEDGDLDFVLHYHGEWTTGDPTAGGTITYIGSNIFVLFNKGNLVFDVVEIYDNPDHIYFQQTLFDWDADGKVDIMVNAPPNGEYFKNLGGNRFEYRRMPPLELKMDGAGLSGIDFDGDGGTDLINVFGGAFYQENCNATVVPVPQVLYVTTRSGIRQFPVTGKLLRKNLYPCRGSETYERINMLDGDGDGDLDLIISYFVVPSSGGSWTQYSDYYENTNLSFEYRPGFIDIPGPELYHQFIQVWARDIDGDGRKDLYYGTYRKSQLNSSSGWRPFWWRNTGSGFRIQTTFRLQY